MQDPSQAGGQCRGRAWGWEEDSTSAGAWKPMFAGLVPQHEMEALSHLGRYRGCWAGDTQDKHYSPSLCHCDNIGHWLLAASICEVLSLQLSRGVWGPMIRNGSLQAKGSQARKE